MTNSAKIRGKNIKGGGDFSGWPLHIPLEKWNHTYYNCNSIYDYFKVFIIYKYRTGTNELLNFQFLLVPSQLKKKYVKHMGHTFKYMCTICDKVLINKKQRIFHNFFT